MSVLELAKEYEAVRKVAYGISVEEYLLLRAEALKDEHTPAIPAPAAPIPAAENKPAPEAKPVPQAKPASVKETEEALDSLAILKGLGE